MPLDRAKLEKLLARMESDSDAEALTSARKACQLVRESNSTWREAVNPQTPKRDVLIQRPEPAVPDIFRRVMAEAEELGLKMARESLRGFGEGLSGKPIKRRR